MATRSSRNKIIWHSRKAMDHIEKAGEQYQALVKIAEGASPIINNNMPAIVDMLYMVKLKLEEFHQLL